MTQRVQNYYKLAQKPIQAMLALETSLKDSGLEHSILELVKMRASQINNCAFCIHMHSTDMRKAGETEMRIYMLNARRDSSLYTPRERAALAWTEALTLLAQTHAPDSDYEQLKAHFTEAEQVNLSLAIGAINVWNRLACGMRAEHPVEKARDAA